MKYLKSFISCAAISLITPTLSLAQEAGYWGYGSMCMARDCAPGRPPPGPRAMAQEAMMQNEGMAANAQILAEDCMQYVKMVCGGVGYSSPNKPIPMTVWCSPPGSKVASQYWNTTTCPPGYTPLGRPYPEWTDYTR